MRVTVRAVAGGSVDTESTHPAIIIANAIIVFIDA